MIHPAQAEVPSHALTPHPMYYNAINNGLARPLMAGFSMEHRGAEVLNEVQGPVFISPAHRSNIDWLALARAAKEGADTQLHFVAKGEIWDLPIIGPLAGWIMEHGGTIPIERKNSAKMPEQTKERISQLITKGAAIVMFSEKNRQLKPDPMTGGDPKILPEKIHGTHILSVTHQVPVIPVGMIGTRPGDRWPVRIVFGKAIRPPVVDAVAPPTDGEQESKAAKHARMRLMNTAARTMQTEIAQGMQKVQDQAIAWRLHDRYEAANF